MKDNPSPAGRTTRAGGDGSGVSTTGGSSDSAPTATTAAAEHAGGVTEEGDLSSAKVAAAMVRNSNSTVKATRRIDTPFLSQAGRIAVVRSHYESRGYRVHSGLQFGCELVLYADDPSRVHSDFCVHIASGTEGRYDWRTVQSLVRSMPDLHKTLILAHIRERKRDRGCAKGGEGGNDGSNSADIEYEVAELAIATEHAPFRHKTAARRKVQVGSQVKKRNKKS